MASAMRILAVSDVHGRVDVFEEILRREEGLDAVLFAGDITPYGRRGARSFLEKMAEASRGAPLLAVPGNVDDPREYDEVEGLVNLHGRHYSLGWLTVVGVGGSPPTPFFTENELSEDEIEEALRNAIASAGDPQGLAVLSHSPPFGTRVDVISSGENVGSHAVREVIEEYKPLFCVCGHIHEGRGVDYIGSTLVVNPGPALRGYYAVIEVSSSGITPVLKRV